MKIFYTSDIHGHLLPTDFNDKSLKNVGLFHLLDKKDDYDLKIDGGDILQGSILSNFTVENHKSDLIAEMMNIFGYTHVTLGNHDFNYGHDFLKDYINNLNAKCVCLNVKDLKNEIEIHDYDLITIDGKKVLITGLVTEFVNIWEREENKKDFLIEDIEKSLEKIENIECDFKILIYHGGIEKDLDSFKDFNDTGENKGVMIAQNYDFDLILSAHQHMPFVNKTVFNTHILQAEAFFKSFVEIDVNEKSITSRFGKIDYNLSKSFDKYSNLLDRINEQLDETLAYLPYDLKPSDKLEAALYGFKLADFVNMIQIDYSKADISITSFANEIKGFSRKVSLRDVLLTYKFPNTLIKLEIGYDDLKKAIEKNYDYIVKDDNGYHINESYLYPKVEHYNFDFFYNVDYDFDFEKRVASNIRVKNKKFNKGDVCTICMNNYRKTGAGGFYMYEKLPIVESYDISIQDLLVEYFKKHNR